MDQIANVNGASDHADRILETLRSCSMKVAEVSKVNAGIASQGGWEAFWNNDGNIKLIAHSLVKASSVHQSTLDMIQLLMGATAVMKVDYNKILTSIEELMESNRGSTESFEYLLHVKQAFVGIRRRDSLLESLISHDKDTIQQVNFLYTSQTELRSESEGVKQRLEEVRQISANLSDWSNKIHEFISTYITTAKAEVESLARKQSEWETLIEEFKTQNSQSKSELNALKSSVAKNMKTIWALVIALVLLAVAMGLILIFR